MTAITRQDTLLEVLVALQATGQLRDVELDSLGETTYLRWDGTIQTLLGAEGAVTERRAEHTLTIDADGTVHEEHGPTWDVRVI